MEGRCAVEILAEFGLLGTSCTPKGVLQFPSPVNDLVEGPDQRLYVACMSGLYCLSLSSLLSRAQNSPSDASSSPAELKITSEFLVVPDKGVRSLLFVDSVLCAVSQGDASWNLTLYNSLKQSSYERLTSVSLPMVSRDLHNNFEGETGKKRRPSLICVYSSDANLPFSTSSSETALTYGHYCLESVLFKLLFGIDAALAKSPVIMCGLPDGRLCFLPLRLPGSRLQVLHGLEQPVGFIGASSVTETSPGHAQCLVAVGEKGRVVLIKTNKAGPEGGDVTARFTERCLPGPVMCGYVDKKYLYYSTGSDLLRLDLSEGSCERDDALHSPASLNVCRLMALTELPCESAAGEVQLLGLSSRGQLQRISLPVGKEGAELSKVTSSQSGRSVRDLLSAIGDVYERASALKTTIKSKNQILQHLNHVLNITFLLLTNSEEYPPSHEKPIRCHALIKWSRLLQKDSLILKCILDNSSPYVLERGWTLSIALFPLSSPSCAGVESASTHFSFPFHNLCPEETLEVALPLAAAGDASLPVTVSCSLIFSLSSLLGEDASENLAGLQSGFISLPLNTLTVDWLHSLQVNTSAAANRRVVSHCTNIQTDTIQAFLRSSRIRRSRRREGAGESPPQPEREEYSAKVRVAQELLRETPLLKNFDVEPQGSKMAPQNVCVSLLQWLFSESHEGVKIEHQGDLISRSVVHAQDPNGHSVRLSAKEFNVGEGSMETEETLSTVEIQVESSSIAAVCGLHHAVLCRLQTLLLKSPERPATKKRVQSLGLRPVLQRVEHLLQHIQQSRVSGAFSVGASTGQMTRSLLTVYRELRENPLPII
ncbi:uncharacterized protein V6R79_009476 [Siganus canaliculatus]